MARAIAILDRMTRQRDGKAAVKVLVSVAVFGLVPVPIMSDTRTCSGCDDQQGTGEDVSFSPLWCLLRALTKRMATKHALARIRGKLLESSRSA